MSHGWMNWGHGSWTWEGGNIFLIVIGVVGGLGILALFKAIFDKNNTDTLLGILNKRYAAGEITKEEFCEILERIEGEHHETLLEMLKRRYASGEITKERFEAMQQEII